MPEKLLTIQEAARKLKVSTKTLRRWEARGILSPLRTSGSHRRYTEEQIQNFKNQKSQLVSQEAITPTLSPNVISVKDSPSQNPVENSNFQEPNKEFVSMPRIPDPTPNPVNKPVTISPIPETVSSTPTNEDLPKLNQKKNGYDAFVYSLIQHSRTIPKRARIGFAALLVLFAMGLITAIIDMEDERTTSLQGSPSVLAATAKSIKGYFNVNVPSYFNDYVNIRSNFEVDGTTTLNGDVFIQGEKLEITSDLIAPNVIYSVIAGDGINVSGSQDITISNDGVTAFQGLSGSIELIEGDNITIDGLKISANVPSTNTFKTVSDGTNSFSASGNSDTLTFLAGTGITLSTDTSNKKITINSSATGTVSGVGDGLALSSGIASIALLSAQSGSGATSSFSGLEFDSVADELTLLQGCGNGELLKFNTGTNVWECSTDLGGASGIINVEENEALISASAGTIDFLGSDFVVSESPAGEINVSIDYPNSEITRNNQNETISGDWTFSGDVLLTALSAGSGSSLCVDGLNTIVTCSASGVTSLNSLTGALTIANASTGGSTITINDATTAQKGIAQFNSTNFSASGGNVNTIQNINTAASPTFAGLTLSGLNSAGIVHTNGSGVLSTSALNLAGGATEVTGLLPALNGGTGLNTSGSTGVPTISSGTWSVTAQLSPLRGGTGVDGSSASNGQILIGNGTGYSLSTLTQGTGITITNGAGTITISSDGNGASKWVQDNSSGILTPNNNSLDLLVGGTSTSSAKFAVLNISGGIPAASVSAGIVGATYISADGILTTTNNQRLTLGSATSGGVSVFGLGTGVVHSTNGVLSTSVVTNAELQNSSITVTGGTGLGVTGSPVSLGGTLTLSNDGVTSNVAGTGINVSSGTGAVTITNTGVLSLVGGTSGSAITGALTIANAGSSGSTITLDNASTTAKGIAQFNSTNFSASLGTINTIQNINTAASPTFAGLTLSSFTGNNAILYGTAGSGAVASTTTNTAGLCFVSGASAPTWTSCSGATGITTFWDQSNGALYPKNETVDLLVGGVSTTSAKFAVLGINESRGNQTATISGNLVLDSAGSIQTTGNQSLTIGGNTTGNITLSPLNGNGTVFSTGNLSLSSGKSYQINGTDVLTSNSLGTSILASSLTSVGTLTSGTWNATAIGSQYGGTGQNFSSSTGVPSLSSGTWSVNATLAPSLGGTGQNFSSSTGVITVNSGTFAASANLSTALGGLGANVTAVGAGEILYSTGTTTYDSLAAGIGGQCLISGGAGAPTWGPCDSGSSVNVFELANGTALLGNSTLDLLIGGHSTTSAKFAVLNVNTDTPVASVSASNGRGLSISYDGSLQTTLNQTLTVGGNTTGNISIAPTGGNGVLNLDVASSNGLSVNGVFGIDVSGTAQCVTTTNGLVTGTGVCQLGTEQWISANGTLYPGIPTLDLLVGGTTTASAKFAFINNAGGNPTASISAGLAGALTLTADGFISTTANQSITIGGSTSGNITLSPLNGNGTVFSTGNINLSSGKEIQINGASILSSTTLGSSVVNSSLTSVGTLTSGTWNATAIGSQYGGTGQNFSSSTGVPSLSSGTWSVNATLAPSLGGTGQNFSSSTGVITVNSGTFAASANLSTALGGLGANVTAVGAGELLYSTGTTTYDSLAAGNSGECLTSGGAGAPVWNTCPGTGSGASKWQLSSGALSPIIPSVDLLLGGSTTASARFAFMGVATDNPVASISASTGNGIYITNDGTIQTTRNQTLSLGGNTTGNINLRLTSPFAIQVNGLRILDSNRSLFNINGVSTNLNPDAGNTYSLGTSASDQYSEIYGNEIYQNGNQVCDTSGNCIGGGAGGIGGSGTLNYIPRFTSASLIGNSQLFDTGQAVSLGTTTPVGYFTINGGYGANSALTINQTGLGTDILSASSSGTTRLTLDTTGNLNIIGGEYRISGNQVLSSTTLGSSVVNSSLTSVGTLTSGTWNATAIGSQYGGTGQNFSSSTGVPTLSSGTWSIAAQLSAQRGGTGIDTSSATGVPSISGGTWSVNSTLSPTLGGTGQNFSSSTGVITVNSGTFAASANLSTALGGLGANVTAVGAGELLYSTGTTTYDSLAAGNSGECLTSGGAGAPVWTSCAGATGIVTYWDLSSGALKPKNSTVDLFVGGTSTDSAKFAVLGVNDARGSQTASVSGNLVLDAAGSLQTTNNQTLTIGGSTTGNILINSDGNNFVGIGTSSPLSTLDVNGTIRTTNTSDASDYLTISSGNTVTTLQRTTNGGTTGSVTIDSSGLLTSESLTASSQLTLSAFNTNGGLVYTNGSGVFSQLGTGTSGQCLTSNTGAAPSWIACPGTGAGASKWILSQGSLSPVIQSADLLLGSDATASARIGLINVASGIPTATLSAGLSGAFSITADGSIATTANQSITIGGVTSGNITLSPLNGNGTVISTGDLNLASTKSYQINGSSVLSSTTLGSSVVNSSLTSVGTLTSGTWNATAIGSQYGGTGQNFSSSTGVITVNSGTFAASANLSTALGGLGANVTAAGAGELLYSTGTTTYDSLAAGNSGECLTSGGAGAPVWTSCAGATGIQTYWDQTLGALKPKNSTVDLFVGGTSTDSAKFAILGVNDARGSQTASVSGNLVLDSAGSLQTTLNQTLTIGGTTTGNIVISPLGGSGTVTSTGDLNLSSGKSFYINGTNVLSGSTLGSGILSSSLTSVGALASGSIASGFGTILTTNTIQGSDITASGTTGFVSSGNDADLVFSGTGTHRISASSGTLEIGAYTLAGAITGNSQNITGLGTINGLAITADTGTITTGTWNATAIGSQYGGTGQNFSSSTGVPSLSSGTWSVNATLATSLGGLGANITAVGAGELLYSTGTTTYDSLAAGNSGECLTSGGAGAPVWTSCAGATGITTYWDLVSGALTPKNSTLDLLLGGTSTTSAKFAVLGVNNIRGQQIASISGSLVLDATGSLQTTDNQTLTIGGSTTGNINFFNSANILSSTGALTLTGAINANTTNTINGLSINGGTISAGTWNGTAISSQYGGTGQNFSSSTGVPSLSSGTWSVNATLATGLGGLGANVTAAGAGELLYSTGTTTYDSLVAGNSGECLTSGGAGAPVWTSCAGATGIVTYWDLSSGALKPKNSTVDLFVGGTSTDSAKFAVLGVNDARGSQTASISGNLVLDAAGSLQTTLNQTLTIGGTSTGNVLINPDGNNFAGFGTSAPLSTVDINGTLRITNTSDATDYLTITSGNTLTTFGRTTDGGTTGSVTINNSGTLSAESLVAASQLTLSAFTTNGGLVYTNGSGVFSQLGTGTTGNCLISNTGAAPSWGSCDGAASVNVFEFANGTARTTNQTVDLLIGGVSTDSAKFAVLNVNGAGPATATVAGNMVIMPQNGAGGRLGIGVSSPIYNIDNVVTQGQRGLNVLGTTSTSGQSFYGNYNTLSYTGGSGSPGIIAGTRNDVSIAGAASVNSRVYGTYNSITLGANTNNAYGSYNIFDSGAFTATNMYGYYNDFGDDTALTQNGYGLYNLASPPSSSNSTKTGVYNDFDNIIASTGFHNVFTADQTSVALKGLINDFSNSAAVNGISYTGVDNNFTTTRGGDYIGIDNTITSTSSTANVYGIRNDLTIGAGATGGDIWGVYNDITNSGGSSSSLVYGTYTELTTTGTSTPISYGSYVIDNASTSTGTQIGAYFDLDDADATKNWALYIEDASSNSYFGDNGIDWGTGGNADTSLIRGARGQLNLTGRQLITGGQTGGNAALIVNQNGDSANDIFSASASGTTRFTIANSGAITASAYTTNGGLLYTTSTGLLSQLGAGTTGNCLIANTGAAPSWGSCDGAASVNVWEYANGTARVTNTTTDLLVGGFSTDSAKFAVLNINNGTPTASVSSGLSGTGMSFDASGSLQTTGRQMLTIGGSTTGEIRFMPTNNTLNLFLKGANAAIGNLNPQAALDVSSSSLISAPVNKIIWGSIGTTMGTLGYDGSANNEIRIGATSNVGLQLITNDTVQAYISSVGDFGIGTSVPTAKLDVAGTASVSGQLSLYGTPIIQSTALQTLTIGGSTTGNVAINPRAGNGTVFINQASTAPTVALAIGNGNALTANNLGQISFNASTSSTSASFTRNGSTVALGETGSFNTESNSLPTGTRSSGYASYGDYIYMVAGIENTVTSNVYYAKVNPDGTVGPWTATASLPAARYLNRVVVYKNYMYSLGGHDGGNPQSTVYYTRINSNGTLQPWASTSSLGAARHSGVAVAYDGYMYYIGGTDTTNAVTTTYSAPINEDGTLGTFNTSTAINPARTNAVGVAKDGYVYIIGGQDTVPNILSTVHTATLSNGTIGTWGSTNSMPAARQGASSLVHNGRIFVFGGSSSNIASGVQSSIYSATLNNGVATWTTASSTLSTSLFRHMSANANGFAIIYGGENSGGTRQSAVYNTPLQTTAFAFLSNPGQNQGNLIDLWNGNSSKFAIDYAGNIIASAGAVLKPYMDTTDSIGIATANGTKYVNFDSQNQRVGIGTNLPTAKLDVNGTASVGGQLTLYTTPTIQSSANQTLTIGGNTTGNIVLSPLNGSGTIRMTNFSTDGGILYTNGSGVLAQTGAGGLNQCLTSNGGGAPSWTACTNASTSPFQSANGIITQLQTTQDFLLGGVSSDSAKFAVLGINNSRGSQTATLSGSIVLDAAGTLQTTNNQTLTLGGGTTGNIVLSPNGNVQLINNGTASKPPLALTGTIFTGGTSTTTKPQLLIEPFGTPSTNWNTNGTLLGLNAPSGFTGYYIDAQLNGDGSNSRFRVGPDGSNGLTISSSTTTSLTSSFALNLQTGNTSDINLSAHSGNVDFIDGGTAVDSLRLNLSNGSASFTTGTNGSLSFESNGTGEITFNTDFNSGLNIGSVNNTSATLSVSGGIGSNALQILNQLNSGDILAASASGNTRFRIANNGDVTFYDDTDIEDYFTITNGATTTTLARVTDGGTLGNVTINSSGTLTAESLVGASSLTLSAFNTNGGLIYTNGSGLFAQLGAGTTGQCLLSNTGAAPTWGSCDGAGSVNTFEFSNGTVRTTNQTVDLLVGGTSTDSAKFAILGVNGTRGNQTASISGNIILDAAGTIQTTRNQTLTIGGNTTGNVIANIKDNNTFSFVSDLTSIERSGPAFLFTQPNDASNDTACCTEFVKIENLDSGSNMAALRIEQYGDGGTADGIVITEGKGSQSGNAILISAGGAGWGTGISLNDCCFDTGINLGNSTLEFADGSGGASEISLNRTAVGVISFKDIVADTPTNTLFTITDAGLVGNANLTGRMGIGFTTTPQTSLHVNGHNSEGRAAFIVDQTASSSNDIFTASSAGTTRFTIGNAGQIGLGLSGSTPNFGSNGQCLLSQGAGSGATWGSCDGAASVNVFEFANGTARTTNQTVDLLIGGAATSSAKFAVLNVNGTGPATATVAGNMIVMPRNGGGGRLGIGTTSPTEPLTVVGNGLFSFNSTGDIQVRLNRANSSSLAANSFETNGTVNWLVGMGGATSNNYVVYDNEMGAYRLFVQQGTGRIGIGTTSPHGLLHVNGGPAGNAAFIVNQTGISANDIFAASSSGTTRFVIKNDGNASSSAGFTIDGAGSLQSTRNQTLTIGGNTTGDIVFSPRNNAGSLLPGANNTISIGASSSARFKDLFLGPSSLHIQCLTGDGCGQNLDYSIGINTTTGSLEIGANSASGSNTALSLSQGGTLSLGKAGFMNGILSFNSSGIGETAPSIYAESDGDLTISAPSGFVNIGSGTGDIMIDPGASNITANLSSSGDFLIQDNGATYVTFADNATTTFDFPGTTTTGITVNANSLTTGDAINILSSTSYTSTTSITGNLLDISRNITSGASGNVTMTGGLVTLSDNCTLSSGSCTHSANVLSLTQNYGLSTGNALQISNVGRGTGLYVSSISGGQAATIIDKLGNGDIFTASASGTPRFTISNTGGITSSAFTTNGGLLYTNSTGIFAQLGAGTTGNCLLANTGAAPSWGSCDGAASVNTFEFAEGTVRTTNQTTDLLVGGVSTEAAKFAITNIVGSRGSQVATLSGSLVLDAAGTLQTTKSQNLTIGGDTTGDIYMRPRNNSGMVRLIHGDSGTGGLYLATSELDATTKNARIKMGHYSNAEEPISILVGNNNGTDNNLFFGGGSGSENAATDIHLMTGGSTTTLIGNTRLHVSRQGNVGIGTNYYNAPSKLAVSGTYGTSALTIFNETGSNDIFHASAGGVLKFKIGGQGTAPVASVSGTTSYAALVVDNTTGDLITASSSGDTRFVVKQNGNVGIGTSTPTEKLDVDGNIVIGAAPNSSLSEQQTFTKITDATAGTITNGETSGIASISAMAVFEGSLYVGTHNVASGAEVYRYNGSGSNWTKVSQTTAGTIANGGTSGIASVSAMTVWNGNLYIGTSKVNQGEVYRYNGGTNWTMVTSAAGTFDATTNVDGISSLAVFGGNLYAGSREPARAQLYRYNGGTSWNDINTTAGTFIATNVVNVDAITTMAVANGILYMGLAKNADGDTIYWKGGIGSTNAFFGYTNAVGTTGSYIINGSAQSGFNEVTAMTIHNGSVVIALRRQNGQADILSQNTGDCSAVTCTSDNWVRLNSAAGTITTGGTTSIDSISALAVYNGRLYATTKKDSSQAEIYRYESPGNWTLLYATGFLNDGGTSIDSIPGLIQYNGSLILGTLKDSGGAEIYSYTSVLDQSYALKFRANSSLGGGEQNSLLNEGSIYFVATASANTNSTRAQNGAFIFSHGIVTANGSYDVAEDYPTRDTDLVPGDVIEIDPHERGYVRRTSEAYSGGLVGIYSEKPGFRLSQMADSIDGSQVIPVALVGRVPARVSTENGAIQPGDYLTSSSVPGVAMKATKGGNVIGKALEPFTDSGEGRILVYVNASQTIGENQYGIFAQSGIGAIGADQSSNFNTFLNVNGEFAGKIRENRAGGTTYTTTSSGHAEWYRKAVATDVLNNGDIVCMTPDGVAKCSENGEILGTVTDIPGFEGNSRHENDPSYVLVGISGQIKTKVQGDIQKGDSVGISSIPGIGEKKNSGHVLGIASENTSEASESSILVTVNPTYKLNALSMGATLNGPVNVANQSVPNAGSASNLDQMISQNSTDISAINMQMASISARLTKLEELGDIAFTSLESSDFATVAEDLLVFGTGSFANVNVLETLNIGSTLRVTENSVDTLGVDLAIQSLRQGKLDIMGGAIIVDTSGKLTVTENAEFAKDVTVKGVLSAQSVKINKGLYVEMSATEASASATAGKSSINGGYTFRKIFNPNVKSDSLIYITPTSRTVGTTPFVSEQVNNQYFRVEIEEARQNDIEFNYLIIN